MNLRTLFAIPVAVILSVTLALAGMLAGEGWVEQDRGRTAVEAVENMRLLLLLQSDLRDERIASNYALGMPHPLPEAARARLKQDRGDTDRRIAAIVARLGAIGENPDATPEPYLLTLLVRLGKSRAAVDQLLARHPDDRTFVALNAIQPLMVWVSQSLEHPIERAGVAVTRADPSLSGLLTEERLATSTRDLVGLTAAVAIPRASRGEPLTSAEAQQVRVLLAQASSLMRMMRGTIEIVGATDPMRAALAELEQVDYAGMFRQLTEQAGPARATEMTPTQQIIVSWGEYVNALRLAIVDAVVARVTDGQFHREREFSLVVAGFALVLIAVLVSVYLLSHRVVGPLAQLGIAITRIAAGDRSVPLTMRTGTREIADMVTSVETLRQAALVADAAATRQRLAARQRQSALREALGIVRTVWEPALALERGVASLCEGIDATVALVTAATAAPPATLGIAADVVRVGLAAMRDRSADLDATFVAAGAEHADDCPEAEFVAHVLAVQAQVDRRDATVQALIQPSLVALRDATSAGGGAPVRELVDDQFQRIEATVAVLASMRAAVTRAVTIVRDLPIEDARLAA